MTCMVNAIQNNSQYMIAPSLQQGFIDKDSGELLAFGVVTFYSDNNHTQLKPVYTVSGPPDDPIFTELPNPLTLSSIGTFIDQNTGQDIIPYYKPYDDEGNVELYYITVVSAENVPQFTRDHYPTVADVNPNDTTQIENFVPDGQFLLHQDQPDNGLIPSSAHYTPIGYGGWVFTQDLNTTAQNYVTFPRFDAPIDNPTQNPRYAARIQCTLANPSDSEKDLTLVINDVNFMQGQNLTFQFTGYSNDGNNHNVQLVIRKHYGPGGSLDTSEVIATVLVTPEIQVFLINFTNSSNEGKTLSSQDKDNLNIILRSPLSSTSDISYTDIPLVAGTFASLAYPPTTPEETKSAGLAGSFDIPAYDGTDTGKFVKLDLSTQNGATLGYVYGSPIPTGTILTTGTAGETPPEGGFLYCNGTEFARMTSDSGQVYENLYDKIGWNYGNGVNGFTYDTQTGNHFNANWNRYDTSQPAPDAGNSGFTFTLVQPVVVGTDPQIYEVTTISAASIVSGHYFRFLVNTTGPQVIQMFWLSVNGAGTIPNVSYDVATRIDLSSSDTSANVATKVMAQANGFFQVPDLRGYFTRYWSNDSDTDPDKDTRTASGAIITAQTPTGNAGNNMGSIQAFEVQSHIHQVTLGQDTFSGGGNQAYAERSSLANPTPTGATGGNETRPVNVYVNGFIKY